MSTPSAHCVTSTTTQLPSVRTPPRPAGHHAYKSIMYTPAWPFHKLFTQPQGTIPNAAGICNHLCMAVLPVCITSIGVRQSAVLLACVCVVCKISMGGRPVWQCWLMYGVGVQAGTSDLLWSSLWRVRRRCARWPPSRPGRRLRLKVRPTPHLGLPLPPLHAHHHPHAPTLSGLQRQLL